MAYKSSSFFTLLVAYRSVDKRASSLDIPHPSSITRMDSIPPALISRTIEAAPASMEFSISSFTTEAGLSTISPAAIFAIKSSERILIIEDIAPPYKDVMIKGISKCGDFLLDTLVHERSLLEKCQM